MQKNQIEKSLHVRIEELGYLSVDSDPQVRKVKEKRMGLEKRLAEGLSKIEELRAGVSKYEEEAADRMLAGASVETDGVEKLRKNLSAAEGEIRIVTIAIERAKTAEAAVQKTARTALRQIAMQVFVAVHEDFNKTFRGMVAKHEDLRKARGLLSNLGVSYSLPSFLSSLDRELFDIDSALEIYRKELASKTYQDA